MKLTCVFGLTGLFFLALPCGLKAQNEPIKNDTLHVQGEFAFVRLIGVTSIMVYYQDGSMEDFKKANNIKAGMGYIANDSGFMTLQFMIIKYMEKKGFTLFQKVQRPEAYNVEYIFLKKSKKE